MTTSEVVVGRRRAAVTADASVVVPGRMIAVVVRLSGVRWMTGPAGGVMLGAVDSVVNHVPVLLGEVGTTRAERGAWSQVAEFGSLILDAGWAWAATAVLVGWLVSRGLPPRAGTLCGAAAGALALVCATAAYYGTDILFDRGSWWEMANRHWMTGSVLFGPALGAAGALIRRPGTAGTLAILLVPVGAALQMVVLPPPLDSRMAEPVRVTVWISAVVAALLTARRIGRRGSATRRSSLSFGRRRQPANARSLDTEMETPRDGPTRRPSAGTAADPDAEIAAVVR